jgi:hypothetical protein
VREQLHQKYASLLCKKADFGSPDLRTEGMYTPRIMTDDPLSGMIASTLFYAGDDSAPAKGSIPRALQAVGIQYALCRPASRASGYLCRREMGI